MVKENTAMVRSYEKIVADVFDALLRVDPDVSRAEDLMRELYRRGRMDGYDEGAADESEYGNL
jgi:hypothetical protein